LREAAASTVLAADLRDHAAVLAQDAMEGREAGARGGRAAARYLEACLRQARLQPSGTAGGYAQRFGEDCQNLLGSLPGTDPRVADEIVVVGAHYDHVGYGRSSAAGNAPGLIHNGADDNASGTAAILEVAAALQAAGYRPRRTVLFAWWDAEEKGLVGSRHFAAHPTVDGQRIRIAVNVDMIGRLEDGRLEVSGTRTGAGLRRLASFRATPPDLQLDFTWDLQDNSDHHAFIERGIPALNLHTGLHDDYHRPTDDVERLDLRGMELVARYVLELTCELADAERLPSFRPLGRSENGAAQRQLETPSAAPVSRLGVQWLWEARREGGAARLLHVAEGGGAHRAGLRQGDAIVGVEGGRFAAQQQFPAAVLAAPTRIALHVERAPRDADDASSPASPSASEVVEAELQGPPIRLGIAWRHDPAEPRAALVTRVTPHSPAARAQLQLRDRIQGINGARFAQPEEFLALLTQSLASSEQRLVLEVERAGRVVDCQVDLRFPEPVEVDASL
jgi:hypothetical protein